MNSLSSSAASLNPFERPAFWGRQGELARIFSRLWSRPPQCSAIIGETFSGKTSLLRYFCEPDLASAAAAGDPRRPVCVYLDCSRYVGAEEYINSGGSQELADRDLVSVRLWRDLYELARARVAPSEPSAAADDSKKDDGDLIEKAFEWKTELEDLLRNSDRPFTFALDNFELIARLPLRNSEWLRALAFYDCAYVVSSRHLLYLLYQYSQNWKQPSPLWNLFSDPIYLGLMPEVEVEDYLRDARTLAGKHGSRWSDDDLVFIRRVAGRHPELLRIACLHLFRGRNRYESAHSMSFLELAIAGDAGVICSQLWHGLADRELSDEIDLPEAMLSAQPLLGPSLYQQALIEVAQGHPVPVEMLFVLSKRGLIEEREGHWCVFSDVMHNFVLKQSRLVETRMTGPLSTGPLSQLDASVPLAAPVPPGGQAARQSLTSLEQRVYDYLRGHLDMVCSRDEIKAAIWQDREMKNSALQKIIERIRAKIEDDPENPHYLIAVRGQGYMLRVDPLGS